MRHADAVGKTKDAEYRQAVTVAYLNAKLGRADKIPPLKRFLPEERKERPTLKSISARFRAAPTFKHEA